MFTTGKKKLFLVPLALTAGAVIAFSTAQRTDAAFYDMTVSYQGHVQRLGWQSPVEDGELVGTVGKGLRLEALDIELSSELAKLGSIEYRVHVQKIGWTAWIKDGNLAGTTGKGLRIEAIEIRLTGELADSYDVVYRGHVQRLGWQSPVKNGAQIGTTGRALRLEALNIAVVKKATAPDTDKPDDGNTGGNDNTGGDTGGNNSGGNNSSGNDTDDDSDGDGRGAAQEVKDGTNPEVAEWKVTYNLNTMTGTAPAAQFIEEGYPISALEGATPTKDGYLFAGWTVTRNGTDFWDFKDNDEDESYSVVEKNTTLYAKFGKAQTVTFKDYTGEAGIDIDSETAEVQATVQVAQNGTLAIPDAPEKDNEYFLGWSEFKNATRGETLYTAGDETVQSTLNTADQNYLGYKVKPSHELRIAKKDVTLYAVYYKGLKATTEQGNEFIWNGAIYRVLNANANTGTSRLAFKVNSLTEGDLVNAGAEGSTTVSTYAFNSGGTYFTSEGNNAYTTGAANAAITQWYNAAIASKDVEEDVLKVDLNLPTKADFIIVSGDATADGVYVSKGDYNSTWTWQGSYYQDTDFATEIDESEGVKQAFALSYGDIHKAEYLNVSTSVTASALLSTTNSNGSTFWLRSAGSNYSNAGIVNTGSFHNLNNVSNSLAVRPALFLTVGSE